MTDEAEWKPPPRAPALAWQRCGRQVFALSAGGGFFAQLLGALGA